MHSLGTTLWIRTVEQGTACVPEPQWFPYPQVSGRIPRLVHNRGGSGSGRSPAPTDTFHSAHRGDDDGWFCLDLDVLYGKRAARPGDDGTVTGKCRSAAAN